MATKADSIVSHIAQALGGNNENFTTFISCLSKHLFTNNIGGKSLTFRESKAKRNCKNNRI